jgi:adenylate cyclase
VAAAIEIVERDRTAVAAGDEPLAFKVAVATGMAFVGNYGSRQKMSFSAIGEPMNLAARLEGVCSEFGTDLLIAETTVRNALRVSSPREDVRAVLGRSRFLRAGMASLKGFAQVAAVMTVESRPPPADAAVQASVSPAMAAERAL